MSTENINKMAHKILIVDDDANNRLLIKTLCEKKLGYETILAENGRDAINAALQHKPDIIIMDIMMPEMNGFEATKILKSSDATKEIPIIIITSLDSREDMIRGIENGANDFLTKPVDYRELFLRVRNNFKVKAFNDYHTLIGANILMGTESPFLSMAEEIALTHHERWDGSGHPMGLKEGKIPISGRIMNITDQYDALRSKRYYKPSFDHKTVIKIITEGDGKTNPEHFDPQVLAAFKKSANKFKDIYEELKQ